MPPTVIPFILLAVLLVIAAVMIMAILIACAGAFTTWLFAQLWGPGHRSGVYFFAALNSILLFIGLLGFTAWSMWEWHPDNSFVLQGMLPWACTIAALICIFLHAAMGSLRQIYGLILTPLRPPRF